MSGVVVGYVASPEGEAAVRQGIAEAKLRGTMVVVVYSDHGEKLDSATAVERTEALDRVHAMLHSADVEHDLRHLVRGKDPVTDVLETADEMAGRPHRDRDPSAHARSASSCSARTRSPSCSRPQSPSWPSRPDLSGFDSTPGFAPACGREQIGAHVSL